MKKVYLEFLRNVAIILVIFNHTGSAGFFFYPQAEYSPLYPFYFFCSVACKVAVPLFWMISGALLINKQETLGELYKKRVLRMCIVLVVFSWIQYVYSMIFSDNETTGIMYFLKILYVGRWATAYWYIYSYIGMLLILPFIRKMVSSMKKKDFEYLFVLCIIVNGVIPIVQYFIGKGEIVIFNRFFENMFTINVVYFIGGYYFGEKIKESKMSGKRALFYLLAGGVAIAVTCFITKYMTNQTGLTAERDAQKFYNSLIIIPTFAVFYTVKYIFTHVNNCHLNKILTVMGSGVFGVMLIENILRERLLFVFDIAKPLIHTFPACVLWVFCVYLCGTCIALVMKKIPGLRKLV